MKINCLQCGMEFKVAKWRIDRGVKFCSNSCRGRWQSENLRGQNHPLWRKQEVECLQCGTGFFAWPSQLEIGYGKFCSKDCFDEWQRKDRRVLDCKWCGKSFEATPIQIKRNRQFCSRKCWKSWTDSDSRNQPHWKGGPVLVCCEECGQSFEIERWRSKSGRLARFCSLECKHKNMIKSMSGEGNSSWRGGASFEPYPPEFNKAFKKKIRDRDNHTCAICRMSGDNVHHINYVKEDTIPANCITLCHRCHIATNYHRDYWQVELSKLVQTRNTATRWGVVGLGPEHIAVALVRSER